MIQIKDKDDVYLIASTRFNTETYAANQRYRRKHNIAAIYGSNMLIREKYPLYAITFVFEMISFVNSKSSLYKSYVKRVSIFAYLDTNSKGIFHSHFWDFPFKPWSTHQVLISSSFFLINRQSILFIGRKYK